MKRRPSIAVNFKAPPIQEAINESAIRNSPELLVATFPGMPGERPHRIDMSEFDGRPELAGEFARYLQKRGIKQSIETREKEKKYFGYVIEYLDSYEDCFGVVVNSIFDFSSRITLGYGDWLNGHKYIGSTLKLGANTKNNRNNAFKRFIRHLQVSPATRDRIAHDLQFHPPWKSAPQPASAKQFLSVIDIAALRTACRNSIMAVLRDLSRAWAIIDDPNISIPNLYTTTSVVPFKDSRTLMKAAVHAFRINRLSGDFRATMKGLARALRSPYGETGATIKEFCFVPETIVPLVILIGLATSFNEITLLTLAHSNIKVGVGVLGDARVYLIGTKERAGANQRRSFALDPDDPCSIGALLQTLKTFTAIIRDHVHPRYSDSVFIAARPSGDPPAGFFDHRNRIFGIASELAAFLKNNNLPEFSLNDLRTIGAGVAAMMSEGDVVVQKALLNHASVKTTIRHYQTAQLARARQEELGHLINERERFVTSKGRIDARGQGAKLGLYRAATPGFDCLDPLNSPIRGERQGSLCSAYGKCPCCPLAVFVCNPTNAARLVQLDQRFVEARKNLNIARWMIEWENEHTLLTTFWLLIVPPKMLQEAHGAELPPIPPIE